MIILRQKNYSFGGDIVRWAKYLTPRIPLGKNSKLYFIWPGTILGALIGVLVGIKNTIKHIVTGKKESNDHSRNSRQHEAEFQKSFSEVPKKANILDYCENIPDYDKLVGLKEANKKILDMDEVPSDIRELIWKCFPSFLNLAGVDEMNKYRKDYMSSKDAPGDYTEVLFTFGNELVYLYDLDRKCWYVQDRTYNPIKEWKIEDGDVLKAIKINFDPDRNKLLEYRIKKWENIEGLSEPIRNYIRSYCASLLQLLDKAID